METVEKCGCTSGLLSIIEGEGLPEGVADVMLGVESFQTDASDGETSAKVVAVQ